MSSGVTKSLMERQLLFDRSSKRSSLTTMARYQRVAQILGVKIAMIRSGNLFLKLMMGNSAAGVALVSAEMRSARRSLSMWSAREGLHSAV